MININFTFIHIRNENTKFQKTKHKQKQIVKENFEKNNLFRKSIFSYISIVFILKQKFIFLNLFVDSVCGFSTSHCKP